MTCHISQHIRPTRNKINMLVCKLNKKTSDKKFYLFIKLMILSSSNIVGYYYLSSIKKSVCNMSLQEQNCVCCSMPLFKCRLSLTGSSDSMNIFIQDTNETLFFSFSAYLLIIQCIITVKNIHL